MICRDGLVGAAGQTAPTKGYELLLKNVSVVVNVVPAFSNDKSNKDICFVNHAWDETEL